MKLPISSITIPPRLRRDYGDIDSLKESLTEYGQLQALLLDRQNQLVDGGRRLHSMTALGWTDCEVMYTDEVSDQRKKIMELVANWDRKEMTWKENILGIATVHNYESSERAKVGGDWTLRATGAMLGVSLGSVQYALKLAEHIRKDDPEILQCDGPVSALRVLMRRQEDRLMAELVARQTQASADMLASSYGGDDPTFLPGDGKEGVGSPTGSPSITTTSEPDSLSGVRSDNQDVIKVPISRFVLRQPDLTMSTLYGLGEGVADHCICDPPYGINLEMMDQLGRIDNIDSMKESHGVEQNQDLFKEMFPTVFRALKPQGFFFLWCDIMQWQRLYDLAIAAGFKVQRWPIVWHKTHPCLNQASQYNTTKTFEIAMLCRKPGTLIVEPWTDSVFDSSRLTMGNMFDGHPFAKPYDCWYLPLKHLTLPGQTILDPFAGKGSSVFVFLSRCRKIIAIEQDETCYNYLTNGVRRQIEGLNKVFYNKPTIFI